MEEEVGWREEGVGWGCGAVIWAGFTVLVFYHFDSSFLVDTLFFTVDIFLLPMTHSDYGVLAML